MKTALVILDVVFGLFMLAGTGHAESGVMALLIAMATLMFVNAGVVWESR